MKALPVVYSKPASDDLAEILAYLFAESGNIQTAQAYVNRIQDRCEKIGLVPEGGAPRDSIFPGLRLVNFERRVVITYLVGEDAVVITNVFYGGRDYAALIGRR